MSRVLHSGEFRLGAASRFSAEVSESLNHQRAERFMELVALAAERSVDLLLLSGNLFGSSQPAPCWIDLVETRLRQLQQQGIAVALLPGWCEEPVGPGSVYQRPFFRALVVEPVTFAGRPRQFRGRTGDLWLYALPWTTRLAGQRLLPRAPSEQAGSHWVVLPDAGCREQVPAEALLTALLRAGFDQIALGGRQRAVWTTAQGRLHSPSLPSMAVEPVLAACPGTPQGQDFCESGPCYCAELECTAEGVLLSWHPLACARFASRQLSLPADLYPTAGDAPDDSPYLQLCLTGILDAPLPQALRVAWSDGRTLLEWLDRTQLSDSATEELLNSHSEALSLHLLRHWQRWAQQCPAEQSQSVLRELLQRFDLAEGVAP
ncbi:hypothetical protein [Desulfuromonas thiophila]|uniref:hypothetical protein n=1 Tax=Desulfuromonas thiophila TaxID=57664 RepID=UPI0024A7E552|nr:hypothetical protein [Desulfuromonas thiophila]